MRRTLAYIDPDSPTLTIDGACRLLHVSRATLHRMFVRGELRRIKVGRRTLIRREQVDALLRGGGGSEGVFG